jgi:hypothetical protein
MKAELVRPDSTAWTEALVGMRHDFYHLPAYVAASAPNDGGVACALLMEDGPRSLLLPLVMRTIDGAGRDACSPYGYPGPIVTDGADRQFEREALLAGVRLLHDEGVVSLFIRTHPLLNPEPPEGVGVVVRHGDTVCVDLTLPAEVQWSQTRRNHRQQIRQAFDAGYVVSVDEDWQHFDAFKSLYRLTMEQRSADAYYFFDDTYFEALRQALDDRVHVATATRGGVVAAAGMFVETGGLVQMHLTGHDQRFAADQPMKLVFHHVRTWCAERGDRVLHLGGGRGGAEDSLFHFKAGFSPLHQPFHTIRVVVREGEYARLVAAFDPALDPGDLQRSFPLYRGG